MTTSATLHVQNMIHEQFNRGTMHDRKTESKGAKRCPSIRASRELASKPGRQIIATWKHGSQRISTERRMHNFCIEQFAKGNE
jgi:hypothetical protein